VGWPPVRSSRKNILSVQKGGKDDGKSGAGAAAFVKVSMDGAPYLRKVDLRTYGSYQELSKALEKMLSSFTIGTHCTYGTSVADMMLGRHVRTVVAWSLAVCHGWHCPTTGTYIYSPCRRVRIYPIQQLYDGIRLTMCTRFMICQLLNQELSTDTFIPKDKVFIYIVPLLLAT
jgi:hypothetical protein